MGLANHHQDRATIARPGPMSCSPRILFLTSHLPYPPVSGGRRREYELLKRLAAHYAVHLAVVSKTADEDRSNIQALQPYCASIVVEAAALPSTACVDLGLRMPYLVRRHVSHNLSRYVQKVVADNEVDIIHVEGFYLMQHVPRTNSMPLLLVEQNIEYTLWRQRFSRVKSRNEREIVTREYWLTRLSEINTWKRSGLCGVVTQEDRAEMLAAVPELNVRIIPDGFDHVSTDRVVASDKERAAQCEFTYNIAFIANFGYSPNVDAALYFYREILPRVRGRIAPLQLSLVGNAPPLQILELAAHDIVVTGRVPTVEPYLDAADLVICPLREGGGIKVKMLEALAKGKAIVTTSIGIQGLGANIGQCVRICDTAEDFAEGVIELLQKPKERAALELAARDYTRSLPTWNAAAVALENCYRELLWLHSAERDPCLF